MDKQTTRKGAEISIPSKEDFLKDLRKVAKPKESPPDRREK
jgi:hypothetical protein